MSETNYERKENFLDTWLFLEAEIHENAADKGFWSTPENIEPGELYDVANSNKGEKLALIHSEVSEVLEEIRLPDEVVSDKIPPYTTIEEELADVVIRLMDFSCAYGYDVAPAILAKMEYNKTRPIKHGKKF